MSKYKGEFIGKYLLFTLAELPLEPIWKALSIAYGSSWSPDLFDLFDLFNFLVTVVYGRLISLISPSHTVVHDCLTSLISSTSWSQRRLSR